MHILYYSPGACSLAPHIVLEEIGIPFEPRLVAIADGENTTEAYLRINPRGRVPTLTVEGVFVSEAPALLLYLSGLAPQLALTPEGGVQLAKCLELLCFMSSSVHIAYAQLWRPQRFLPADEDTKALSDFGRAKIVEYNGEIEARIASPWAIGEDYSVADPYLLVFYRWGIRIGLDMAGDCPRWTALTKRTLERAAVQRAIQREGIGTVWKAV